MYAPALCHVYSLSSFPRDTRHTGRVLPPVVPARRWDRAAHRAETRFSYHLEKVSFCGG